MSSPVTEPDLPGLIPPLLACLVTAAVSSRPPPALLPLLTPVLSQRVQLLSEGDGEAGSWLPLLSWDDVEGQQLSSAVRESSLEPHPVSGEVEFQLEGAVAFRRRDRDTLQARIQLEEPCLKTIYHRCSGGEDQAGAWRLNSLSVGRPVRADDADWYPSIAMAEQAPAAAPATTPDADDGYWDQYRSELEKTSPCESPSGPAARGSSAADGQPLSEDAFYAQYGEVQPALDDPGSFQPDGQSSLPDEDERHRGQRASTSVEPHRAPGDLSCHASSSAAARLDQPTSTDEAISITSKTWADSTDTTATQKAFKDHIEQTLRALHSRASTLGIGSRDFGNVVREELERLDGG